jgi:hypothetical protein
LGDKQPTVKRADQLDEISVMLAAKQRYEARRALFQYLQASPQDADAWYMLGLALNCPADKVAACNKALRFDPNHRNANQQLFWVEKCRQPVPKSTQYDFKPIRDTVSDKKKYNLSGILTCSPFRIASYGLRRLISIIVTIILGIFITMLLANKQG